MKKFIILAVVVLSFCITSTASAFYGGVNYMHTTIDFFGIVDATTGVLALKGGHEVNDNFAVEARLGLGITDDDMAIPNTGPPPETVTVETDYVWGLYARPGVKAGKVNFYALLGFAGFEGTLSMAGFPEESADDTGFSYGVGAEFMVTDKVGINLEYLVLPDLEIIGDPGDPTDVEIDSFNLGVSFQF